MSGEACEARGYDETDRAVLAQGGPALPWRCERERDHDGDHAISLECRPTGRIEWEGEAPQATDRADLDQARATARRALTIARRLLNTHATERKGGPLVSRLSSGEFTARMNELAALERELG